MTMKPLTLAELPALRALADKATPGPWRQHLVDDTTVVDRFGEEIAQTFPEGGNNDDVDFATNTEQREDDAAFIAAARDALPRALDTIEAQAVEIEKAGEVARTMRDCLREANEKIEAQAKEIGVLREVLRPLAGIADTMSRESGVPDAQISNDVWVSVRLGQCRRARAALAKEKVDG